MDDGRIYAVRELERHRLANAWHDGHSLGDGEGDVGREAVELQRRRQSDVGRKQAREVG